ncbi:hypothetical protein ACFPT7_14500 [Acidicapsa dinghuensis]|uniref:Uncharacterized protein n=1 Tax=Acidicapsa dinghuensis TaxID=2218256 RepID=A0ABW1EJD6_9BACT|nr:hypothetical protein [Acidicapsa dinghuensis]
MTTVTRDVLPESERHYWAFALEMTEGDRVLLFTHHFPFALVRVSGPYNYIHSRAPELGVWFRHFRKVDDVHYYGDFVKNARIWENLVMTATITPLRDVNSGSYQVIERWLSALSEAPTGESE